jgi:hypothetical protein
MGVARNPATSPGWHGAQREGDTGASAGEREGEERKHHRLSRLIVNC